MRPTALRLLRVFGWSVAALLSLVGVVVVVWAASNWRDIDPVPRPAALALPAAHLTDQGNAYFALLPSADDPPLPPWTGDTLNCGDRHIDECVARQLASVERLQQLRQPNKAFGQHCERLLNQGFAFEERLAPVLHSTAPIANHTLRASRCSSWLLSGAVLAAGHGRSDEALNRLRQADRLARGLLEGSHSLIAQMVAMRVARDTLGTMAALAVRDRALAQRLEPLLRPLPDQTEAARRWIVFEAAYQRGLHTELSDACLMDTTPGAWLCRHRIGWHPERNAAAIDAHWMTVLGRLEGGLPATIEAQQRDAHAADAAGWFGLLTWRNTMGHAVMTVGRHVYGPYLARQADLDLAFATTALVVRAAADGVAVPDRAAWLARQPVSADARGRIAWQEDGQTLQARTWVSSVGPPARNTPRDALRVHWP